MRKTIYKVLTLTAILGIGISCQYEAPEVEVGPRGDVSLLTTVQDNRYNLFVQAIGLAGLTTELDAKESVTVFAPNDDAFNALMLQLGVTSLTQIDAQTLAAILRYHIIETEYIAADLPRAITTSNGVDLYVTKKGNAVSLNGKASVILTNRFGRNGVFHGINSVLTLPSTTIYDAIAQRAADVDNPEFTYLKYAIDLAGLTNLLDDLVGGSYTVFAPTDAAFEAYGVDENSDFDAMTIDSLTAILEHHVLPTVKFTIEYGTKEFTLAGNSLAKEKAIRTTSNSYGEASIKEINLIQTNGVLNVIDAVIQPLPSLIEAFSPKVELSGSDGFGFDPFGALIAASGYTGIDELEETFSVYANTAVPLPGSFASNAAIIDYIERHIFEGNVNIPSLADGTKITSIGGDTYYVNNVTSLGRRYVNGLRRNAFTNQSLFFETYNGSAYLYNGGFVPNPQLSIVDVLEADANFSLISAALAKTGKADALSKGNYTFLALRDADFSNYTGFFTVDEIIELDEEDDAESIEFLAELIDRQAIPIVAYNIKLSNDFPTYKNVLGEDIFFASVNGSTVIVENAKRPTDEFETLLSVDIKASNGVIHVISSGIDLVVE